MSWAIQSKIPTPRESCRHRRGSLIFKSRDVISSAFREASTSPSANEISQLLEFSSNAAFERRNTRRLTIRRGIVGSPPRSLFRQRQWNPFDPVGGTSVINRCTSRRRRYRSRSLPLPLYLFLFYPLFCCASSPRHCLSLSLWIGKFT